MKFNFSDYEGMISEEEFEFLAQQSSDIQGGVIVEIGSWRGKSAIAFAKGIAGHSSTERTMIFCVEPHAVFTGIYGGKFGSQDRKHFYEAMLKSGAWEDVRLINLKSEQAAIGFPHQIDLLFIDGDHSEAGVRKDIEMWTPHLAPKGKIIFDDAIDEKVGPHLIIKELISSGKFKYVVTVGKIVMIQKFV